MKVLWVTNLVVSEEDSLADPGRATFGGWVANMLDALGETDAVDLAVLARSRTACRLVLARRDNVTHAIAPMRGKTFAPAALRSALARLSPDILHVEGAEMVHAADAATAFGGKVVVSMQGVMAGFAPYEFGGLPVARWALGWHRPARALTASAMLASRAVALGPRLAAERRTMARADHVVGRTEWDRAHAAVLAPQAPYHHVARILRPAFTAPRPFAPTPVPGRIFIGNAHRARKGAHVVVAALAQLKERFGEAHIVIAGEPPARSRREWRKAIGYPAELARMVDAAGLGGSVHYTGVLGAEEMAEEMLRAEVVVLASLIENSPNTLGEAMMLGRPVVCAFAGGAPDMAAPGREALFYRASEPVSLAHQIARLFENPALAAALGVAAAERARRTHDRAAARDALLALYRTVAGDPAAGFGARAAA